MVEQETGIADLALRDRLRERVRRSATRSSPGAYIVETSSLQGSASLRFGEVPSDGLVQAVELREHEQMGLVERRERLPSAFLRGRLRRHRRIRPPSGRNVLVMPTSRPASTETGPCSSMNATA